jgi:murein DD-endopeptidase MepM/ murein hydrolase activator NlpD
MSNGTMNRISFRSRLRSRAAAVTVGVCASAVLASAGVATAADGMSANPHITESAGSHADARADAQADAVQAAAKQRANEERQAKEAQEAEQQAEAAKRAKARSWMPPVTADYVLTAPYSASSDLWSSTHSGQDFAVPSGTTVRAVHGGTVVKAGGWGAGDGPAYGNAIVIRHDWDEYSQYAHLSRVEVSVGDTVATGERIARSGNTGNSTGPHLHFEIRTTPDYGSAVDPVRFLRAMDVTV